MSALVLRLLRAERDRLERSMDHNQMFWSQPNAPKYTWFDRDEWLADTRLALAQCNAAIVGFL